VSFHGELNLWDTKLLHSTELVTFILAKRPFVFGYSR
jgi:hypothetical protein